MGHVTIPQVQGQIAAANFDLRLSCVARLLDNKKSKNHHTLACQKQKEM